MRMTSSGNPNKEWRVNNLSRALVIAAKKRATRAGIPFDITYRDVPIPLKCPVFGTPLTKDYHSDARNYPSIDRIRPELGYVKGNVAVISLRANRLKSNASLADLEKLMAYLREYL